MEKSQENTKGGLDPFQALTRLSHVITGIDHLLEQQFRSQQTLPLKRRLIYARNTLVVSLNLWQDDLIERLNASRDSFYVYCMIDAERLAFVRRMRPALEFTAEEMRSLGLLVLNHLIPLVDQAAEDAVLYATENRQSLIMAKNALGPQGFPIPIACNALSLPTEDNILAPPNAAISG